MHSRRGRTALRGGQVEDGQALFPNLTGPSVRPEGSFKSSGSSNDNMASAHVFIPPVEVQQPPLPPLVCLKMLSRRQ